MASIKEITQKVRELRLLASIDLDGVPYQQRFGAEGQKRVAQRELSATLKELETEVQASLIGLFPVGDPEDCKKFAEVAEDGGGAFTVSARELYRKLATEALKSTPNRLELGINEIGNLNIAIQSTAAQCGAVRLPLINLGKLIGARFESLDDAAKYIYEQAIFPHLGDELNVIYLQKRLLEEVLKVDYEQSTVPVVVLESTEGERTGLMAGDVLFPRGNLVVDVGSNPDRDMVIRAFKQLKEVNKGKKARKSPKGQ